MTNFFDWYESNQAKDKPWIILGKGPSFSKIRDYNLTEYNTIALNHVVRETKVTLAHAIDFDVAVDCQQQIYENAGFLLSPLYPNSNNLPGSKSLHELVDEHHFLKKLQNENRFLWYDLKIISIEDPQWENYISGKVKNGKYNIVPATFFSVEAAVNLLALAGEKKIRSLGIDGGNTYSTNFNDIKDKTLLANGRQSFNIQFLSLSKTTMAHNIDYSPLTVDESPIRVFVGSMPEQMLGVKVLEYSIRKHASVSVDVYPLFKSPTKIPQPKDSKNKPRTPFSFQRFLIPELKNFKGRAIYVDSDMQVFRDIKDLWMRPMGDCDVLSAFESSGTGRRPQFAVMLMDCQKLQWKIEDIVAKLDKGELTYEQLMYNMAVAKKVGLEIEREWNSLEHYEEGKTSLVHYTDMDKQPWLFTHNPLTEIWVRELCEAIDQKFIDLDYVIQDIKAGNVRPSLLYQIKNRVFKTSEIPAKILKQDKYFIPPHLKSERETQWKKFRNKVAVSLLVR